MEKRPTLRDIAKRAGVSYVTVSLALRSHPKISKATKERIQAIAKELDYRPDPMLSSFMVYRRGLRSKGHQGTIAWINTFASPRKLYEGTDYKEYWEGSRERCHELGYELEEFRLVELEMNTARLSQILMARNISGLLLPPQPRHHASLDLDWDSFSAVTFGFTLAHPKLHLVTNAQFQSGVDAVQALLERGYRRIGLVADAWFDEVTGRHFSSGYWAALRSLGQADAIPIHFKEHSPSRGESVEQFQNRRISQLRAWISRYEPEVILTDDPKMLHAAGCVAGELPHIALLILPRKQTDYAGIYQNSHLIGRTAVDLLVGLLYRNERGLPEAPVQTLVKGVWKDGKSVPSRSVESVAGGFTVGV